MRTLPPQTMDYECYFNGDVSKMIQAGTYADCRDKVQHDLERNETVKDPKKALAEYDKQWAAALKDPNVKFLYDMREQEKKDKEEAIIRAAENRLTELRGKPVELSIVNKPKSSKSSPK